MVTVVKQKDKMSLSKVKEYFKASNKSFTDSELLAIRDFLYDWAEINYSIYLRTIEKEKTDEIIEEQYKTAA